MPGRIEAGGREITASDSAAAVGARSWFAVHTQIRAETTALENLLRQGYRVYLPRCRTWISHARRRQLALRPLFPRYLFAAVDRPAMRWRPIISTVGVSDLVRVGDRPAPVAEEIIETIRAREREGCFDRPQSAPGLRPGELVRVTGGAFAEMVGRLAELQDNERVIVLLDLLGRAVRARLPGNMIEIA